MSLLETRLTVVPRRELNCTATVLSEKHLQQKVKVKFFVEVPRLIFIPLM